VLIALFSVRSENLFVEQLHYNLLYRWFLDMDSSEPVFDNSTFSKNQQRLMQYEGPGFSSSRWCGWRASKAGSAMSISAWMAVTFQHSTFYASVTSLFALFVALSRLAFEPQARTPLGRLKMAARCNVLSSSEL
jgi:hypothetical protein